MGLGTDVSGGYSPSILSVIRQAVIASNLLHFQNPEKYAPLSFKEIFAVATLGGSQLLGLDSIVEILNHKYFDAII